MSAGAPLPLPLPLSLLAAAAVAAALTFAGSRCRGVLAGPRDSALYRLVLYALAGQLALHLLLTGLGLAGVPWRLPVVAAALAAAAALAWRWLPAPADCTRLPSDLGWGEGLALGAWLLFTAFALSLWITIPDFIYHWGLKGHRFYLAGGVDYRYLAAPWNWVVHPDYPNLLPELYAVTALAAGRFDEPAMMLWSAFCFALLLAAVREALRRAAAGRLVTQAALAGIAMALAAYGIGSLSAGGADWLIALALAAALPPLLSPVDRRGAAQIGVIAAFAAAAKVEGVALAAILIGTYTARAWAARAEPPENGLPPASPWIQAVLRPAGDSSGRCRMAITGHAAAATGGSRGRRLSTGPLRVAATLGLPAAAVILPWLGAVWRYHLFGAYNSGPLAPERAGRVLAAMLDSLQGSWWGFGYGLALLPLLALDRRLRAVAAALLLQLLFYLYVYLSVPFDAVALVAASFPRLVMHLLPAALTGAAIALERPARSTREGLAVPEPGAGAGAPAGSGVSPPGAAGA